MKAAVLSFLVAILMPFTVSTAQADSALAIDINFQVEQVKGFARDLALSSNSAELLKTQFVSLNENANSIYDQILAGAAVSDYEKHLVEQMLDVLAKLHARYGTGQIQQPLI